MASQMSSHVQLRQRSIYPRESTTRVLSSKSGSAKDSREHANFYVSYKRILVIQWVHAIRNSSQAG
jgi:hypothetical protein